MVSSKNTSEAKLARIIEEYLSDIRFDKHNFAWHMGNQSPRFQEEFYKLFIAFIEEMATCYEKQMIQTKHAEISRRSYEIREFLEENL